MPASPTPARPGPAQLVGRSAEVAQLRALVEPPPAAARAQVVLGGAGIGKTVLLQDVAGQARSAGLTVLAVTGRESGANLAFSALHQLLRPVLPAAAGLPGRQREALAGALGITADATVPDRLLTGIALLTLLSDLSERAPVLAVVDDAHWIDQSSLEVLAFAAHRLDAEPVVLLLGARAGMPPSGFDRGFPELHLQPLPRSAANRLLDAQPRPPRGRARHRVLAQAAGNPMALIELSRVIAADPRAGSRWAAEPLPVTDRITAGIAAQLDSLPGGARKALLLAAVADNGDLTSAAGDVPGLNDSTLAPAEQLGLVKVDQTGVQFSHPLVRSAVYHAADPAERAAAHSQIAAGLDRYPDRQAWHLAAAAPGPDTRVAAMLEDTATHAQRRGGAAAAAAAMERAAELSPDQADKARRLVDAASMAHATSQADWVLDLANRAMTLTSDPEMRLQAHREVGWALTWSSQHAAALAALIAVAEEAADLDPWSGWAALSNAGAVAYQSGARSGVLAVREAAEALMSVSARVDGKALEAVRLWVATSTGPYRDSADVAARLKRLSATSLDLSYLSVAGAAAWLADQTGLAVDMLRETRRRIQEPGVRGASGSALSALGWASLDAGRWDYALAVADEAADLAAAYRMSMVAASSDLIAATILALRGEAADARDRAGDVLRDDTERSASVEARARHALGLAATAEGKHSAAFAELRGLFADDGAPLHYHVSYLAVADVAAAAALAGRRQEGQRILRDGLGQLDGAPTPRLEQLLARAGGLLAEPDRAEACFDNGLSDPAGDQWPFERAQLSLDYGEWLRRRRRVNEAKPLLTAAFDTFRHLQARPWAQRAGAELRACGVAVSEPAARSALSELTPQQRRIIYLAGKGLSNREIGARLFLSPRTIGSYLYRSYPKLGITGRHQLRDVIAEAGALAERDGDGRGLRRVAPT